MWMDSGRGGDGETLPSLDESLFFDALTTVKRRKLQRMSKHLGIPANTTVLSFLEY